MTLRVVLLMAVVSGWPIHARAQLTTQVVATGLSRPVGFVQDPLFANVFYIVEQGGLVKVLRDGQVQGEAFADLRNEIATGGERGLLGMAFSPDVMSGRVYFNYTNTAGHTVVSRVRRTAAEPFRIDPGSRLDLLWPTGERFIHQPFANHNGGHLAFGPDGYLYIGLGDGGDGNDPFNHAQNPSSLLGKMLRIDVNVADSDPAGYRVPADNPFLDGQPIPALGEIWSFGLRNPWRYSFDDFGPGATGGLLIADVGQAAREEINFAPVGAGGQNYGWRVREGRISTPNIPPTAPAFGPLWEPLYDYGRDVGQAVTGGFVYRGSALGATYRGRYFFADSSSGRVFSLVPVLDATGAIVGFERVDHTGELGKAGPVGAVTSFGRDRQGELYLVSFSGRVLKIAADAAAVAQAPMNVTAAVDGTTVTVQWTPPISGPVPTGYQLEAGSVPGSSDAGAVVAGALQTAVTVTDVAPGTYYVRVRTLAAAGAGEASNEVNVVVAQGGCVRPPPAASAVRATVLGNLVTLSWSASSAGDGASRWTISAGSSSGLANLVNIDVPGTERSVSGGVPGGRYYVRVRGSNACGTGAESNEIIVEVP